MSNKPGRARKGSRIYTSTNDDHAAEKPWVGSWTAFVEAHRIWWDRVGRDDPVYSLPIEIIECLAERTIAPDSSHRASKPLISTEDAEAEREFLGVCSEVHGGIVGFWDGSPISYPTLNERNARDSHDAWNAIQSKTDVLPANLMASVKRELDAVRDVRHQVLGYVGALTFHEPFRRERGDLQARWKGMPDRPHLPIRASIVADNADPFVTIDSDRHRERGQELEQFRFDFDQFLRKWRLGGMTTWELPDPWGPFLAPLPLGLLVKYLGPDHLAIAIPSYYDIPSNIDLRRSIREQQRLSAICDGIEMSHPVTNTSRRDGRESQYETAFRMWLIEHSVRSRYGVRRGLVTRLVRGFAGSLKLTVDRATELRKIYLKDLETTAPSRDV